MRASAEAEVPFCFSPRVIYVKYCASSSSPSPSSFRSACTALRSGCDRHMTCLPLRFFGACMLRSSDFFILSSYIFCCWSTVFRIDLGYFVTMSTISLANLLGVPAQDRVEKNEQWCDRKAEYKRHKAKNRTPVPPASSRGGC